MGFAPINAAKSSRADYRAEESLEVQEGRIAETYSKGLILVEDGHRQEAVVRSVLLACLLNMSSGR